MIKSSTGINIIHKTKIFVMNFRVLFGTTQLYVFANPLERDKVKTKYPAPTYEMAQQEIASHAGLDVNSARGSQGILNTGISYSRKKYC